MKIKLNDKHITISGRKFTLKNAVAGICCGAEKYDVMAGEKYIGMTNNSVCVFSESGGVKMRWELCSFENAVRIRLSAECGSGEVISSMLPLAAEIDSCDDIKIIKVPFDNDDWVRYTTSSWEEGGRSYGVGALFAKDRAMTVGAVDYSVWKTGIDFNGKIEVKAGIADKLTRDSCRHGGIEGKAESPELWLFENESWQGAFEMFANKYSECNKRLTWNYAPPKGWNSWYAYMMDINADKYEKAVDFISELDNMENAYVNFDAFWTALSDKELKESVKKARDKGLIPGIYLAPFATWIEDDRLDLPFTDDMGNVVEAGTSWKDVLLRDHEGNILPRLDGGLSLDMTNPVCIKKMETVLAYLKDMGYKYIKLDFLGHAAREGAFFASDISTGLQCYNNAMQKILSIWSGDDMFISLSIAPIFPGGMGHARRICCDVFGDIKDSRYLLNSLTYGWWLNKNIYEFNDPDHICFDKGDTEAKFRFISGLIGGTVFLISSKTEEEETCRRVKEMTGKKELMELIDKHITFHPSDDYIEEDVAHMFIGRDNDKTYIAMFNFSEEPKEFDISRFCENGKTPIELFNGTELKNSAGMRFILPGLDCGIVRI
ncbi:MAG: hypothetical protein Q4G33_00020 [bacterium]|nr:hypothetical protein [bacterium]